jgi:hypothetical protein
VVGNDHGRWRSLLISALCCVLSAAAVLWHRTYVAFVLRLVAGWLRGTAV